MPEQQVLPFPNPAIEINEKYLNDTNNYCKLCNSKLEAKFINTGDVICGCTSWRTTGCPYVFDCYVKDDKIYAIQCDRCDSLMSLIHRKCDDDKMKFYGCKNYRITNCLGKRKYPFDPNEPIKARPSMKEEEQMPIKATKTVSISNTSDKIRLLQETIAAAQKELETLNDTKKQEYNACVEAASKVNEALKPFGKMISVDNLIKSIMEESVVPVKNNRHRRSLEISCDDLKRIEGALNSTEGKSAYWIRKDANMLSSDKREGDKVSKALSQLVRAGRIKKTGKGRESRYIRS